MRFSTPRLRLSKLSDSANWIADAHREDGKRFNVRNVEKLIAFPEVEAELNSVEHIASTHEVEQDGLSTGARVYLEDCIVGAEKAAWFAFIAIGWQRYPLTQESAAVKGYTHEVFGDYRRQSP